MTTTYLPDLTHRSRDAKWLPTPLPAELTPEWLQARYDDVIAACDAAGDDANAWIDVIGQLSELESFIGSHGTRVGVAYRQATDDADATAAYERWNRELSPVITDAAVEVARRIVASPCTDAIAAKFGPQYLPVVEAACRAHAPVNTALETELSDVLMQHTRIFGKGTITWRGEERPFSFARKAALDTDRAERHAAWQSKIDYVQRNEAELQKIFDDAMELRVRMAKNLDQPDYAGLRYLEMRRFDWTSEDAERVRGAIVEHVVPLATQLQRAQAAGLGTELLHPADEEIHDHPSPEPLVDVDGQLEAATQMFASMGEAFGAPFQLLVDEGLIDLPARSGKGTGAFCAGFPWERMPFIFCNSVGSHDDVTTLVHEYGHALQGWRSRDIEPVDLQHPTLEACEIHSMTLELLAHPFLAPFFGDGESAATYRRDHLRSTLNIVPYLASVDEFQHRIYAEGLDADGRAAAWRDVAQRYQPGIDWAADDWYAGNRWMLQLHIFQYPFYYLDYGLARLVSWELWLDSLEDRDAAIEKYLALCSAGGTKSFRELVTSVGLGDPFDPAVIARTVARLRPHLGLD